MNVNWPFFLAVVTMLSLSCASEADKKGRFLLKGNNEMAEGNIKGAISYYDEALAIDPFFKEAYYNRGLAKHGQLRYAEAIADFDKAIELDETYRDAQLQRVMAYLDFGENYKALESSNALVAQNKADAQAHFVSGLSLTALKRYQEAKQAFEQARVLNPENVELYINLATVNYHLGEWDKATEDLTRAKGLDPGHSMIYNLQSLIHFEQGAYQKALDSVEEAISLEKDQAFYYNNRGLYRLYLGDLEEGLKDINFSLKQNSRNLYALRNKGIYYYKKGEMELAERFLGEVSEKDPSMPLVEEYLPSGE
ncbi:Tetratricopeptide repeat-containing protein [Cyclobacterium xiamenense]|uniref:Tetratricopeptide repeat-containing protein n=1 Tax=Cyclobacterium xiamenense TaxID=1297121 RepID=A0A1H7B7B8_9BACT|nr:tetratricopeptide repeat protein [Cyclobacterium xiamenense]SEJ73599.1 Tetratricopeptide repeat-containing protein [Cyclobacterium xiamenense]